MYRAIAKLLALFLVFSSLSWAADTDELDGRHGSFSAASPVLDGHNHGSPADGDSDLQQDAPCNHCCHGTAHYLGLPYEGGLIAADFASEDAVPQLGALQSRAETPPQHPPRS